MCLVLLQWSAETEHVNNQPSDLGYRKYETEQYYRNIESLSRK